MISFDRRPLRQYRAAELRQVAVQLQDWSFHPNGTEGYRTAEVTAGGVDTDELSSTTMESKKYLDFILSAKWLMLPAI